MPWITNSNGIKEYKLSAYAKEELPTWSEMYEEFWLEKVFVANMSDKADPYWKIPHSVYLLSVCLNQLNKMVWEDNCWTHDVMFGVNIVTKSKGMIRSSSYRTIQFTQDNAFPPIFTIPFPNGQQNPFILSHGKYRMYIGESMKDDSIAIGMSFHQDGTQTVLYESPELKELIKPYRNYFDSLDKSEGNKIAKNKYTFGIDPAL